MVTQQSTTTTHERNPGVAFDATWFKDIRLNLAAIKSRADTLGKRRSVKKEWQAAWLLRAVTCLDLTTLSGDDSDANVKRLCFKGEHITWIMDQGAEGHEIGMYA